MPAPALIVIDVQRAFENPAWGPRNNPQAEQRIAEAIAGWRERGAPLIHIRHASRAPDGLFVPGTPAFEFMPQAQPHDGEPVITKDVNSAFIGTDLEQRLRDGGVETVALAGLTTDHCCSTTARMAANLGFETWVLGDAMATFDREGADGEHLSADLMHRTALASLQGEFADVIDTRDALARLRRARLDAATARRA
jgi:nicotinamidase-related amidase